MRHDTGYGICSTVMCDDTDKANAHLIAAAPEMYAMLEATKNLLGKMTFANMEIQYAYADIEQLLAKARGEITNTSEQITNKQQLNDKSPELVNGGYNVKRWKYQG